MKVALITAAVATFLTPLFNPVTVIPAQAADAAAAPAAAQAAPSNVCLTHVTEVVPGGIAEGAGMRPGDFIISIEGSPWTVFDSMGPDCLAMGEDVRAHMLPRRDEPATVFVLYRPETGEQGEARGRIVRLSPAAPGPKGYSYSTSNRGETYRKNTSKKYAEEIRALYGKSLKK